MNKERKQRRDKTKPSLGVALGGGGPMGGVYQIGALRALDEALEGLDLNDLDAYVGVNAGSFVAANLANQITPSQMCRIFVRNESDIHPFHPEVFYRPALLEYAARAKAIPKLLFDAVSNVVKNPTDQTLLESLTVMAQAVPSGVFDNTGFHDYISRSYSSLGRTNDFARLRRKLLVIASDVESGETVRFGEDGLQHVPISKAIQSSMASPGLYVPVELNGHYYMDGTLNKGMHASVAVEAGCDIVFAVNPVVPVNVLSGDGSLRENIVGSGMPNVLSQSYRTMVHSRLNSGLKNLKREHPGSQVFLFEPSKSEASLFFSSVFSFNARKRVCEQAYQITRADLRVRAKEIEQALSPLGIRVRHDILNDEARSLSTGLYGETMPVYNAKVYSIGAKKRKSPKVTNYFEKLGDRVSSWF